MSPLNLSGVMAILCFVVKSQTALVLDKINTSEMTGSYITAINNDFKGYLWVGTSNGLNKFDGYNFKSFRSNKTDSTTLSNPSVRVIKQFNPDELFIGTSSGLNIYSFETNVFKRVKIDTTLPDFQKKNAITCLEQLKDGRLIVGTTSGLMLYEQKTNQLWPFIVKGKQLLSNYIIQSACLDKKGNLWFGTKHIYKDAISFRVFKYNLESLDLKEFIISDYGSTGHVGISEDYLGNIWVAVDDGLVSIHPKNYQTKFYKAPKNYLSCVSYFQSKDHTIYQGFWSFGITVFDIEKKEFKTIVNEPDNPRSLMSNKVWAIYKDDNDVSWYGTEIGLQKQSNKRPNFELIKRNAELAENTFSSNQLISVLPSQKWKDKLFLSVDGNGFAIYNKQTKQTDNYYFGFRDKHCAEDRFINQFHESDNGDIYAAGQYNFIKISKGVKKPILKHYFYIQQHHFTSVFPDFTNKNNLWIGGVGQIAKFNTETEQFIFFKNPADYAGVFWSGISNTLGTFFVANNALLKIDKQNNFTLLKIPDAGNISCIESYDGAHVLLGTSYLGLIKYNLNNNTYKIIKNNKNEVFSEINSIKRLRNTVWIGTNVGLYQYFPYSNEIIEYNTNDGLPSTVVNQIAISNNNLYITTNNGLVILNPNKYITNFVIPKTDITSINGIGNSLEIITNLNGKEINIPQNQNSFKINFTVLDFNLPLKNIYKYRLLPLQKEWKNNLTDHSVSFNELNVGAYEFQVIGANSDNIWNTDAVSVKINIVPPFYNSTGFYFILLVIGLIITIVAFYFRNKRIQKTRIYLEKTIEERTEEIKQKQKLLENKTAELLDSITYAQKIQKAFLVGEKYLSDTLPESFIYFKPKEKVSGDFFWIGKEKNYLIIAAADCTGHGVPGAMLSVIGTTLLNKIIHEEKIYTPGKILTELNYLFYNQLNIDEKSLRDGMDISIVTIDLQNQKMFFAGARNNAIIVLDNKLTETPAQRESIGESKNVIFETKEMIYNKAATYYLFSDGYKDQFGGPNSKKLASKAFKDILLKGSKVIMNGQKNYFGRFIRDWQGTNSQTDDRIIIGFKLR